MNLEKLMAQLEAKHSGEKEYLQAVREVLTSIEEVYKLPNSTVKEDKSTFTKQEIINIISLLI